MTDHTSQDTPKSYSIWIVSRWQLLLVMTLSTLGVMVLSLYLKEIGVIRGESIFILLAIILLIMSCYYLSRKVGTARIRLVLDEEGIEQIWETQFGFSYHSDRYVCWKDIVEYRFEQVYRGQFLKARLKDGSEWFLDHDYIRTKGDDFKDFREAFTAIVNQINAVTEAQATQIHLSKTFPQTRSAKIMSIGVVVFLTLLPIALITLYVMESSLVDLVAIILGVSFVPLCMFVYWVYNEHEERKKYEETLEKLPDQHKSQD